MADVQKFVQIDSLKAKLAIFCIYQKNTGTYCFDSQPIEHVNQIFCSHIAAGTIRVWASSETRYAAVDCGHAELK